MSIKFKTIAAIYSTTVNYRNDKKHDKPSQQCYFMLSCEMLRSFAHNTEHHNSTLSQRMPQNI